MSPTDLERLAEIERNLDGDWGDIDWLCSQVRALAAQVERLERVLAAVPVECEHEMTPGLGGFCYCTLCGTAIYVI